MKNRVLWKMLLLSIVTIGIYRLYWFVKTRREMMDLNPNIKILTPAFLIIPVAVIIVALGVLIASIVNAPSTSDSNCPSGSLYGNSAYSNGNSDCSASSGEIIGILAFYAGIFIAYVLFVVWEWSYAHGVEDITGGKLSFAMGLIVLILVPDGIDILIIQDSFNKLGHGGAGTPQFQPAGPSQFAQQFPQQQPPQQPPSQPNPQHHGPHEHHGDHHDHQDHQDHHHGGNPPHQPLG